MKLKVFVSPSPTGAVDGIKRVTEALYKHLPDSNIELVGDHNDADVLNLHGLSVPPQLDPQKPIVYTSHGLFWQDVNGWPDVFYTYNQHMIDAMKQATAVVAVSDWVAHSIRRGLMRPVNVIKHGVDATFWTPPTTHGEYILYNKGRPDPVSNPAEMNQLAAILTGHPFVATFGTETPNVRVTGYMEHEEMQKYVRHAKIYLSLARETFGIGTLEALACGVPVVGWDFGGNREIVEHGVNGYLAEYGNYTQLARYVKLAEVNRAELSKNARMTAAQGWTWPVRVAQYAELFHHVYRQSQEERPTTSVVVTCHNLGRYLRQCLDSVKAQEERTWECLIVDDASEDDTEQICAEYTKDLRFTYIKAPKNLGLSEARNLGFSRSRGKYIFPLDADDMLAGVNSLNFLAQHLDEDRSIHVAYGHLDIVNDAGEDRRRNDWPYQFDWYGQIAHLNQLPYCSMMRREVWENTGGYRARNWRAEDAYFWTYASSFGYVPKKVTEQTVLLYRIRSDSKSALERQQGFDDGDWTGFFPYRLARTAREGAEVLANGLRPNPVNVPFGAAGKRASGFSWPVWSHHDPIVSVVIPVGPNHSQYVIDAIDSVISQDFVFYEIVVVNDTGKSIRWLPEWVKVVDTGARHSIGYSRNLGVQESKAPLILFLDADDMLMPSALSSMVQAYADIEGERYIYCDWYDVAPGSIEAKSSKPYDQASLKGMHPISCLMERQRILDVGGFDEHISGWEDWDFFIRCAISGYCGYHLADKLLVYRTFSGKRREDSLKEADNGLLDLFNERYQAYITGEKKMSECCGGEENAEVLIRAKQALGLLPHEPIPVKSGGKIRLEFIGMRTGGQTFKNERLSRQYTGGNNPINKYADADTQADAEFLVGTGLWKVVRRASDTDLTVAQVFQADVPTMAPVKSQFSEFQVASAPQPTMGMTFDEGPQDRDIDPSAHTVRELEQLLAGQDEMTLLSVQQREMGGKNRKTVLTLIDDLLTLTRRVTV